MDDIELPKDLTGSGTVRVTEEPAGEEPDADTDDQEKAQQAFHPNQQPAERACKIVSEKMVLEQVQVKGIDGNIFGNGRQYKNTPYEDA